MSRRHLVACASCARHVRVSESACPFCGAVLPEELRSRLAPLTSAARLSRAAVFALGTGAVSLGAACSTSEEQVDSVYGGPPMADAAYGGPPQDSGADTARDAPEEAPPLVDAAYGGPPQDAAGD